MSRSERYRKRLEDNGEDTSALVALLAPLPLLLLHAPFCLLPVALPAATPPSRLILVTCPHCC